VDAGSFIALSGLIGAAVCAVVRYRNVHDGPSFTKFTGPEGQNIIVDSAMMEYLNSSAPQPSQAALDELMDQVRAVRIFNEGCHNDTILGPHVGVGVSDPGDMDTLRAAMKVVDGAGGHCMCFGGPTFEMLSASHSRLALISVHHGRAIRWSQWKDDAKLVDGRSLLKWIAQRGVVEPLRELEKQEVLLRRMALAHDRWVAAMPSPLRPAWSSALGHFGDINIGPLRVALESGLPDEDGRIQALLEWYGSGAGPWSGFPSYEQAAEDLLLEYPTVRVLQAIESVQLSSAQLQGAARLFGGWSFSNQRPGELRELPATLKKTLWLCVKDTADDDKRARARRAFRGPLGIF
jgi:hypothetical protein